VAEATKEQLAAMRAIGKEWERGDKHRIYFNLDIPAIFGLKVSYYKTGNVSGASLNGGGISNAEGRRMLARLDGKVYFDFADGKYHASGLDNADAKVVFAALKEMVAAANGGTKGAETEGEEI
jgi:hypothetical protein